MTEDTPLPSVDAVMRANHAAAQARRWCFHLQVGNGQARALIEQEHDLVGSPQFEWRLFPLVWAERQDEDIAACLATAWARAEAGEWVRVPSNVAWSHFAATAVPADPSRSLPDWVRAATVDRNSNRRGRMTHNLLSQWDQAQVLRDPQSGTDSLRRLELWLTYCTRCQPHHWQLWYGMTATGRLWAIVEQPRTPDPTRDWLAGADYSPYGVVWATGPRSDPSPAALAAVMERAYQRAEAGVWLRLPYGDADPDSFPQLAVPDDPTRPLPEWAAARTEQP